MILMRCEPDFISFGLGPRLARKTSLSPCKDALTLTAREKDMLLCFSRGLSYKETAGVLGLSVNTVNDHVKTAYRKLGVNSRAEAVFEAVSLGVIAL